MSVPRRDPSYGYTNDNQLTGVSHTNGSFTTETFGFDVNGNRNTGSYTTGAANQTNGDGTYTYAYDAEGNLTSKTTVSSGNKILYKWDTRNRLTEVDQVISGTQTTVALYTYDVMNRPIKVVEGGSTRYTLYDGQTPLLDFNGSGTVTSRYLNGPAVDQVLARDNTSGGVAWYLTDRLGTVRDIVDNTGAIIDHIDYGAFGNVLAESTPASGDRFKYAGMEADSYTGLYYDRARWYDPNGGKFIGQDPIGFSGGDGNLYRYVGNRPINATDSTGLYVDTPDDYVDNFGSHGSMSEAKAVAILDKKVRELRANKQFAAAELFEYYLHGDRQTPIQFSPPAQQELAKETSSMAYTLVISSFNILECKGTYDKIRETTIHFRYREPSLRGIFQGILKYFKGDVFQETNEAMFNAIGGGDMTVSGTATHSGVLFEEHAQQNFRVRVDLTDLFSWGDSFSAGVDPAYAAGYYLQNGPNADKYPPFSWTYSYNLRFDTK